MVRLFLLLDPVQKPNPVNREGDGSEILFYLSLQDIRPHLVQHEAELVIRFREEDRFIDAGGVLKGDELHGIAVPGVHCLARDQPANGGDLLAHICVQVLSPHIVEAFQNILVAIKGMDGEKEAEGLQLMLEHKGFGVGRWREIPPVPPLRKGGGIFRREDLGRKGERKGGFCEGGRNLHGRAGRSPLY